MLDDELKEGIPEGKQHAKRLGRELAMQYLFRCDMQNELPSAATFEPFFETMRELHQLRDNRHARKGKEYAIELYGIVGAHQEEIDRAIRERSANWEWSRLSLVDRNIMRIAVAEMLHVDEVPPVVSIDEAVEIARDYSGEASGNFINGVLNGIKDTLKRSPREGKKEEA